MAPRMTDDELFRHRHREYSGPIGQRLVAWWEHCESEHDATILDYRRRVTEWHREHHPDCDWQPQLRRWTQEEVRFWVTSGVEPDSVKAEQ